MFLEYLSKIHFNEDNPNQEAQHDGRLLNSAAAATATATAASAKSSLAETEFALNPKLLNMICTPQGYVLVVNIYC